MEAFALWLVNFVHEVGYLGLFLAMGFGNMLVPIPVEAIMIPAGYLVQQQHMNFWLVIAAAVVGDICGSLISFYFAMHFGRRVLVRWGKYIGFGQDKVDMLQNFFISHGEVSVLTGRLVPGLRHFMAFPAGLSHMNVKRFVLYTGAGGGLWSGILVFLGYLIGDNKELVNRYLPYVEGAVIAGVVVMIVVYVKRHRRQKKEAADVQS